MLSIIICSRNKTTDSRLLQNIRSTIGTEYEIVHVDNSEGKYGICGAYNDGVRRSKGEILCFMHEDICYYTDNWGKKVEKHMSRPDIGMLGVAGSIIVPDRYDWRFGEIRDIHIIQRYHTYGKQTLYYTKGVEWDIQKPIKKVAAIDGCWFCIKKNLFSTDKIRFDEDTFQGFHMYDTDISMQVNNAKKDVYVCSDIVLEHFSEGLYTQEFEDSLRKFQEKWKTILPYSVEKIDKLKIKEKEFEAEKKLAERIEKDRLIMSIRDFYEVSEKGKFVKSLSVEAERLMEQSLLEYIKTEIKYSETNKEAYNALCLCFKYKMKVCSMIVKYLYYRFLNRNYTKSRRCMQSFAIK